MANEINIKLDKPTRNIKISVVQTKKSPPVTLFSLIKSFLYLVYVLFTACLYLLIIPIYIYFGVMIVLIYAAILLTWLIIKVFMIDFIISTSKCRRKNGPV